MFPILDAVDLVLVMSVFAGFGGQKFLPETLAKTRALRAKGFRGRIEMDGGINAETIAGCAAAGCDTFVSGSALFGARDMTSEIGRLREIAGRAREEAVHAR